MIALYKHIICLASKPAEIIIFCFCLFFLTCLSLGFALLRFHVFRFVPYHGFEKSVFTYCLRHFHNVFIKMKFIHFLTMAVIKKKRNSFLITKKTYFMLSEMCVIICYLFCLFSHHAST